MLIQVADTNYTITKVLTRNLYILQRNNTPKIDGKIALRMVSVSGTLHMVNRLSAAVEI